MSKDKNNINILCSLDLEMNQPSDTIIQVGYVVGNVDTGDILVRRSYDIYTDETIDPSIISLTGITQERVNNGISLEEAYMHIQEDRKVFEFFRNPLTWGGGDSQLLRKQLGIDTTDAYVFGRRWIDCKTLYISLAIANGLNYKGGLARVMTRYGLKFEGRKHDAMYDAENTFILFRTLLDKLR